MFNYTSTRFGLHRLKYVMITILIHRQSRKELKSKITKLLKSENIQNEKSIIE